LGRKIHRHGYDFQGWFDADDKKVEFPIDNVRASTTLYAKWEAVEYEVIFDSNFINTTGGSSGTTGTENKQKFTFDVKTDRLSPNGFEIAGYTFAGWATWPDPTCDDEDNEKVYGELRFFSNQELINNNQVYNTEAKKGFTLYAQWNNGDTIITPPRTISAFVAGLYQNLLGRPGEAAGLEFWERMLTTGDWNGREVAEYFIVRSPEVLTKDITDEEFVTRLYRGILMREPELEGYNYWIEYLKGFTDQQEGRREVLNHFADSPEFERICKALGIFG